MAGKITPYILVGYVQTAIFLCAGKVIFAVPFVGDPLAFFIGSNLYIVANLALGFLIPTLARNQMQAMQPSFFSLLPSIMLSGFMFPFARMPGWAQAIGGAIPATHFFAADAQGDAERCCDGGCRAGYGGDSGHHGGDSTGRHAALSPHAGLTRGRRDAI